MMRKITALDSGFGFCSLLLLCVKCMNMMHIFFFHLITYSNYSTVRQLRRLMKVSEKMVKRCSKGFVRKRKIKNTALSSSI